MTRNAFQEPSEKLYQYIFDNVPIGIIYYDSKGILTACNDRFVDIIGSSREKLVGIKMTQLPDANIVRALEAALSGSVGYYEGMYASITSGKTIPIKVEFHPLQPTEDRDISGIGMVEDISERYFATKKLRESEERYRTIFNNDHDPMLLIDLDDGCIQDANPAALKYYGWSHEEITSMKISDINTMPPEDVRTEMEKAKQKEKNAFHFQHRLADGTIRDVEVYSGLIQIESKFMLYSIIHDITDRIRRKKELQKFKLGIERTSNIVFITDKDGRIEYINPSFTRVYGYTLQDVKGKTPRVLKSGKKDLSYYEKFWETITHGNVMSDELLNRTKAGDLVDIKLTSNPIIDEDGKIIGFIAIQENITEKKKKDQKLKESLNEKEVLLSEIHHRVKNNLAIISALLELNLYQDKAVSIEEFVKSSQMRIKAMANVHEMLYESETFSKISFSEYITRLIDTIRKTSEVEGFNPLFEVDIDDIELNINQAIPTGLIVNELLFNATKHAFPKKDEGRICVTLQYRDGMIHLEVKDSGVGISEPSKISGSSLGMTLINILSQQLEAELEMGNADQGFKCTLTFQRHLDAKGASTNLM